MNAWLAAVQAVFTVLMFAAFAAAALVSVSLVVAILSIAWGLS